MKHSPFRKQVADYIRKIRKQGYKDRKTEINPRILAFCAGWTALSDEFDKINQKYEKTK